MPFNGDRPLSPHFLPPSATIGIRRALMSTDLARLICRCHNDLRAPGPGGMLQRSGMPFDSVTWRQMLMRSMQRWAVRPGGGSGADKQDRSGEPACKPGSVENSHSSTDCVTAALQQPTRKHAGLTLQWALRPAATSLFGLAPGGVCRAVECYHRRGALLPHRFTLTSTLAGTSAVYFLLHFPWARAPQALPGTLSTGARTFLPTPSKSMRCSDCPAGSPPAPWTQSA